MALQEEKFDIESIKNLRGGEILENAAKDNPQKVALVFNDERITYQELNRNTDALAASLSELGIKKGDRVLVCLPNWPEFAVAFYASMKLGAIHVGVSTRFRSRELKFMLQNTHTTTLIIPEQFEGFNFIKLAKEVMVEAPDLKNVIVVRGKPEDGMFRFDALVEAGKGKDYPRPEIEPLEDLATLIFTSGTTGFPKGAMHTHAGFFGATSIIISLCENTDHNDVFLGHIPMTVMFGAAILCAAISLQATVVLVDTYNPKRVLELIEREKVTEHSGTPAMFTMEMNHPDFKQHDLSSLKVGVAAGAFFPTELIRKVEKDMGIILVQGLGTSETVACSMGRSDDSLELRAGTLGNFTPGSETKVIDEDGNEVPQGESGELLYRGWSLCKGYWENPKENEKAFDKDGWWHTGDLVKIDDDGHLCILGRIKELIIRGGFNVVPSELEELLSKHPKVLEVAAVGTPNPILGESICLCVIPEKGEKPTLMELREYLIDQIADYKLPDELCILEDFPRMASGKSAKFGTDGLQGLAKADEKREKYVDIKKKKKK